MAFICTALAACGGELRQLTTFQAASLALGQSDLSSGQPNRGGGPGSDTLAEPMGMALTPEGGLLVADAANNRVLFFATIPSSSSPGAIAALGQPDLQTSAAAVAQMGLSEPWSVAVGAGRMAVADKLAHRVLVYDQVPAAGQPVPVPSVVIGQPDFVSSTGSCGAAGLQGPTAVAITPDGKLIVADRGNNRVLIWNQIPAAGAGATVPAPSLVLGQSDAAHCAFADDDQDGAPDLGVGGIVSHVTARVMAPVDVWSDGRRLVVADGDFNRVLIWNEFPRSNFQPADVVLGQPDFTGRWANGLTVPGVVPLPTARNFNNPRGIHSDGASLAVADLVNNRVLVWSAFPQANHQPADLVLGHAGFGQAATHDLDQDGAPDAPSAQVMSRPTRVLLWAGGLLVSDGRHHRVLKFDR